MGPAQGFELFEDALHVPEIVHQVRENNDIEFFLNFGKIMRICVEKLQFRMLLFGAADHFL